MHTTESFGGNRTSLKSPWGQAGFSLIEIMVSVAIMAVIASALTSMIVSQQREVRALTEKMLVIDLETQLRNTLLRPGFCGCLFRGSTLNTLTSPLSLSLGFASIPSAFNPLIPVFPTPCAPMPGGVLAAKGAKVSGSSIKVADILLKNVVDLGGGNYSGELSVTLDSSTLIRPLKDVKTMIFIAVGGTNPAAKDFLNCGVNDFKSTVELKCGRNFSGGGLGGGGGAGCAPPACPLGWTDLGSISSSIQAGGGLLGGAMGYNSRFCVSPTPYAVVETKCAASFGGGGLGFKGGAACAPPVCASGWTDLGPISSSYQSGGFGGAKGYRSRFCIK
jgi:prepilin-type N-terminal cleavage/methylation domain-containing protein